MGQPAGQAQDGAAPISKYSQRADTAGDLAGEAPASCASSRATTPGSKVPLPRLASSMCGTCGCGRERKFRCQCPKTHSAAIAVLRGAISANGSRAGDGCRAGAVGTQRQRDPRCRRGREYDPGFERRSDSRTYRGIRTVRDEHPAGDRNGNERFSSRKIRPAAAARGRRGSGQRRNAKLCASSALSRCLRSAWAA